MRDRDGTRAPRRFARLKRWHQTLGRISGLDIHRIVSRSPVSCIESPGSDVVLRLGSEIEIELESSQYITRKIARYGCFDPVVAEAVLRLSEPGMLHLDVGANTGYVTALMAGRAGATGRVVAFEPVPRTFARLHRNAERMNARLGRAVVEARREALGGANGKAWVSVPSSIAQSDGTLSIAAAPRSMTDIEIEVKRLDDVADSNADVALMKLDVEGAELGVLEGARSLIAAGRVPNIVFEEHGRFPGPAARFLAENGYRIWRLGSRGPLGLFGPSIEDPRNQHHFRVPPGFEPDPNYLATRDESAVQHRMRGMCWRCVWRG